VYESLLGALPWRVLARINLESRVVNGMIAIRKRFGLPGLALCEANSLAGLPRLFVFRFTSCDRVHVTFCNGTCAGFVSLR
jgi:hypothetical protein